MKNGLFLVIMTLVGIDIFGIVLNYPENYRLSIIFGMALILKVPYLVRKK